MRKPLGIVLIAFMATACAPSSTASTSEGVQSPTSRGTSKAVATFAGGCFWCVEKPFEKVPGVQAVISGYTGGHVDRPTYREVGSGKTGHTEAIQVHFDPDEVRYEDLLEVFWRQINPTDAGGQFVDRGSQYRSEIFYHDEAQKLAALESRKKLAASGRFKKPVVTPITALRRFYVAEDYHQDFYKKDPRRYESYRRGSGRDRYLDQAWGKDRKYSFSRPASRPSASYRKPSYRKPSDEVLRARLTKIQYEVTQRDGTEPPFKNTYWDNKKAGIYVDIVSGEPLFSSLHKYKSGTGWPSFFRALEEKSITKGTDHKMRYTRTELRSTKADSHLGHLFKDGPRPTGLRYCINSAALRFIPKESLEKEGLVRYLKTFTTK